MKNKQKTLSDKLKTSLLLRFFLSILIYSILGAAAFYIAVNLYFTLSLHRIWPVYRAANWLYARIEILALTYVFTGCLLLFLYFLRQPFAYLQEVVDAAGQIYQKDTSLIELSEPLKEAAFSLNYAKMNLQENERIAKEAEQRKNDLVVYLAHDLKTPLTSVIGYLTLLRDEIQISEELREKYLSISLEKAERLEDLINEFFEITRFSLSHITLETGKVNLTRMLEQLTYEFRPMLAEKKLQCCLKAPGDLMIRCDADKMQRVFDNLLRNAVNYSFEESTIEITVTADDQNAKVSFLNHGITIPKEKLERIFEQFYRLDTSRATKSGGAGLGLAIAKEITELHGGIITAKSEDEVILFELLLPSL